MNRRPERAKRLLAFVIVAGLSPACGKRADPLAPYVKTPQVPTGLEVSQVGEEIEIRAIAPRTTTEGRPLPVIELEWLQGAATGEWAKVATSLVKEPAAPGEMRTKRFPMPTQEMRFSVRAQSGKMRSVSGAPVLFKPALVPVSPSRVEAINIDNGVELRWVNPAGAEPWPTPLPIPSPSPAPTPTAAPSSSPVAPSPTTAPVVASSPPAPPEPPTIPPSSVEPPPATGYVQPTPPPPSLAPKSSPSPTPSPTPPTGIRIFRTDGAPRLAREPVQASTWIDLSPRPGETPCYALRYAASFKPLVESAPTEPVCVEIKDIVAPEPPGKLVADIGDSFVELSWAASPSTDVAYYRVYRTADNRPRALLLESQGPVLRVRDSSVAPGPRMYEVAAVDKAGNESRTMPSVRVIVP